MEFEWDEAKSQTCFLSRGFDFAYAAKAFFDSDRLIRADLRRSYGEARFHLYGRIESRVFVLVYTHKEVMQRELFLPEKPITER